MIQNIPKLCLSSSYLHVYHCFPIRKGLFDHVWSCLISLCLEDEGVKALIKKLDKDRWHLKKEWKRKFKLRPRLFYLDFISEVLISAVILACFAFCFGKAKLEARHRFPIGMSDYQLICCHVVPKSMCWRCWRKSSSISWRSLEATTCDTFEFLRIRV